MKRIWQEEEAQGATEYILLLVVIVGIAFLFKGKIEEVISAKVDDLGSSIKGFTSGAGGN